MSSSSSESSPKRLRTSFPSSACLPRDCWVSVIEFLSTAPDFFSLCLAVSGLYTYVQSMCPQACDSISFPCRVGSGLPSSSAVTTHVRKLILVDPTRTRKVLNDDQSLASSNFRLGTPLFAPFAHVRFVEMSLVLQISHLSVRNGSNYVFPKGLNFLEKLIVHFVHPGDTLRFGDLPSAETFDAAANATKFSLRNLPALKVFEGDIRKITCSFHPTTWDIRYSIVVVLTVASASVPNLEEICLRNRDPTELYENVVLNDIRDVPDGFCMSPKSLSTLKSFTRLSLTGISLISFFRGEECPIFTNVTEVTLDAVTIDDLQIKITQVFPHLRVLRTHWCPLLPGENGSGTGWYDLEIGENLESLEMLEIGWSDRQELGYLNVGLIPPVPRLRLVGNSLELPRCVSLRLEVAVVGEEVPVSAPCLEESNLIGEVKLEGFDKMQICNRFQILDGSQLVVACIKGPSVFDHRSVLPVLRALMIEHAVIPPLPELPSLQVLVLFHAAPLVETPVVVPELPALLYLQASDRPMGYGCLPEQGYGSVIFSSLPCLQELHVMPGTQVKIARVGVQGQPTPLRRMFVPNENASGPGGVEKVTKFGRMRVDRFQGVKDVGTDQLRQLLRVVTATNLSGEQS